MKTAGADATAPRAAATTAITAIAATAIAAAAAACGEVKDQPQPPDGRQTVIELPATPNRDLDLLFVIDDSPSMLDKQVNLTANFPSFLERLQALPGGLPNLHVGVVTTDMGTKGSGNPTPGPAIGQIGNGGCSGVGKAGNLQKGNAPITDTFLRDLEAPGGTRTRNYTGTLAETFRMMALVGAGGCGFEQPLAAMRAALDNNPANVGFLRPEAMLGVVFLADEDDCSLKDPAMLGPESPALGPLQSFRCMRFGVTCAQGGQTPEAMNTVGTKTQCGANPTSAFLDDVAPYRDFLRGLKRDARRIAVAGIFGPPEPVVVELRTPPSGGPSQPAIAHSCTYQNPMGLEVADPASRLSDFLEGFPDRFTSTTICQRDLSSGLMQLAELFRRSIGSPCLETEIVDTEPQTAGLQADCVVEDLVGASAIAIPACPSSGGPRPCWRLEEDRAICSGFGDLKLVVQRETPPDPATTTRVRCAVPDAP